MINSLDVRFKDCLRKRGNVLLLDSSSSDSFDYVAVSVKNLVKYVDYKVLTKNVGILSGDKDYPDSDDYFDYLVSKAYNHYNLAFHKELKKWFVYKTDSMEAIQQPFATKQQAIDKLEELVEEYINNNYSNDLRVNFIKLKKAYYLGEVDMLNAKLCKLVVIEILRGINKGEKLLCTGLGLDRDAQLMAYQALTYGKISKKYLPLILNESSREYFRMVIGEDVYQDVMYKLYRG